MAIETNDMVIRILNIITRIININIIYLQILYEYNNSIRW